MPGEYEFLQGEGSLVERIQMEDAVRRNQKPKIPPTPTLAASSSQTSDGTTYSRVTVSWSPVRKDIDYIIRWKKSGGDYTYERSKTSPHVIQPVEGNTTVSVGLASERRQYGTRSQFAGDVNVTTAKDPTAPATAITLTLAVNNVTGTIYLTWTPVPEADLWYYELVRDTSSPATTSLVQTGNTTHDDFNVTPGTTYYYRVRAVDRTGNAGSYSNEVSGVVAFIGTLSGSPTVSCITDPSSTFSTAVTQPITISAGSRYLTASVQVLPTTLIGGSGTVEVRFSVGSSGAEVSNQASLTFSSLAAQTTVLKSAAPLSVSGTQNLLYEWRDAEGDSSSYQLTSAGSIQVTAS